MVMPKAFTGKNLCATIGRARILNKTEARTNLHKNGLLVKMHVTPRTVVMSDMPNPLGQDPLAPKRMHHVHAGRAASDELARTPNPDETGVRMLHKDRIKVINGMLLAPMASIKPISAQTNHQHAQTLVARRHGQGRRRAKRVNTLAAQHPKPPNRLLCETRRVNITMQRQHDGTTCYAAQALKLNPTCDIVQAVGATTGPPAKNVEH